MYKNILFVVFAFTFVISPITAQNGLDFKSNKQLYLKGKSALIGNTILGVSSKKPFNDFKKFNDILNLKYIDVDNDKTTFSSSQAELQIPENKKIKYAALYWSAIYKYNKGVKKTKGNRIYYSEKERSLPGVNKIYLKTPNSNYQSLEGNVVFNSKNSGLFNDTQPYVCFANVTNLLQEAKTTNGVYTVANIKATQGYVSGGSAGGWLLYVVYENEEDTKKYFTTYNGFIGVQEESLSIDFSNFKTNETGPVKTSLLLGALEGDYNFKSDKCAIIDAKNKKYITLTEGGRKKENFFNSTITSISKEQRNPSSRNTLGLDILKMPLPNEKNTILDNNSTKTSIKLSTKKDGFYVFFVAFETEISETFVPVLKPAKVVANSEIKTTLKTTPLVTKETSIQKPVIKPIENTTPVIVNSTNLEPTKLPIQNTINKNTNTITVIKPIKEDTSSNSIYSSNSIINSVPEPKLTVNKTYTNTYTPSETSYSINKRYLVVTNTFANSENAKKWQNELIEEGYGAKTYVNPVNNFCYVYVFDDYGLNSTILEKKRLLKLKAFKELVIFDTINNLEKITINSTLNKIRVNSTSTKPTNNSYQASLKYLLITNVFSVEQNAIRWQNILNTRGYNAQIHTNPENNWYYVYVFSDTNLNSTYLEKKRLLKLKAFKELGIKEFYF